MTTSNCRGLLVAVSLCALMIGFTPAATAQEATPELSADAELAAKGVWNATATYAKDDIVTSRGSAWISLRANNKNKVPGQTAPTTATWWRLFARGFNPTGAWSNATKYQPDDLVTRNGQTWRAKKTNSNRQPAANQFWELLAQKGVDGADGAQGPTGPAGPNTGINDGTKSTPSISFSDDADTGIYSPTTDKIAMVTGGTFFLHNMGSQNIALGFSALNSSTGNGNSALGDRALAANTNGQLNTAVGASALKANLGGNNNTAVGSDALALNTVGNGNVAIGSVALSGNLTGGSNVAIGVGAMTGNQMGDNNVAIGRDALANSTAGDNTAVGYHALYLNNGGFANTAVGANALAANTTGLYNVALGHKALTSNDSGQFNTAVGQTALELNTLGSANTAVGAEALRAASIAEGNTALGSRSLASLTTGAQNTAGGNNALMAIEDGAFNVGLGSSAMVGVTSGNYNVALGSNTLPNVTTGSVNIAIGDGAGFDAGNPSSSIFIGSRGAPGDDETIRIGAGQSTAFMAGIHGVTSTGGIAVYVNTDGQLGTATSSRRYKDDIETLADVSTLLTQLRPVSFHYKQPDTDGSKPKQFGLIAEEVEAVAPELAAYNKDRSIETVKYHFLPPLLLAGWQAQQQTIAELTDEVRQQKDVNAALEERLRRLEALLPQTRAASLQ